MKRLIGLILVVAMIAPIAALGQAGAPLAFADDAQPRILLAADDPCKPTKDKPIPDCVNVGDIFKTKGQKSFIPSNSQNANGGNDNPENTGTSDQPTGIVGFVIYRVIDILIKLVGSVALIVFIIGGLYLITAEGKEDRLEKGKTAMIYALIGVAVAFFSFLIVSYVQSILF